MNFIDGIVDEDGVNVIAEIVMTRTDDYGWDTGIFEEVNEFY